MCGFVGVLERDAGTPVRGALEAMTATLAHRGPDGAGIAIDGRVGLGHRRLRVLDLSERADQPMWNQERNVAIVFNGEIYNFRELRAELKGRGARFRTASDTEVILELYARDGEAAICRLDGMFAFALWDRRRDQLVLARDGAGQKPLFYSESDGRLVFGSEIKAIHRHPSVSREPNLDALAAYLTYGYFPAPETAYRGVQTLAPASYLVVDGRGARRVERYFRPSFEVDVIRRLPEAVERLRPLVNDAVRKRLVSDAPLGAFLSGGLDSSIVVGLMSESSSRPVRTFSIGFEDAPAYDELDYAEEAARRFGCEHTSYRIPPPEPSLFERLVHHHDGPFGDSSAIPTYIVSKLAREHVTVALNGDGGDELFCGYSRLAAAALSERVPLALRRAAAASAQLLPWPRSHAGTLRRARQLLEISAFPLRKRIQSWCSFFRAADLEPLLKASRTNDTGEHFERALAEADGATPLARLLYLNYRTYLPEDLLVKMDRMTMAHGLEARSPFLDRSLTTFAARLPDDLKLSGWTTKRVLREAYRDLVPGRIRTRSKMGFGVPVGAWFRGGLRPYVEARLTSADSPLFEHLHRETVLRLFAEHVEGGRDRGQQLFCLLTLALWLETF